MSKSAGRPTIRDVAEAAGVSVTTVSDAMNGKGRVDPGTQAKVRSAATKIGWQPKRSARALRSGQTGIIAFCLPRRSDEQDPRITSTDYYLKLAAACAIQAVAVGRFVLLAPGPVDVSDVAGLDVDGAIVVDPLDDDPMINLFAQSGIPVVTVDRDLASESTDWVSVDNSAATHTVLDHLSKQGAKSVSLITSAERLSWLSDVTNSYQDWCQANQVDPNVCLVDLDQTIDGAATCVRRMAESGELPDAIYAVPGGAALGAVRALTELGFSVPGDVLVVAGVDGPAMESARPSITALDLVPEAVAAAAIQLLVALLDGGRSAGPIETPGRLAIRESTRRVD